VVLPNIIDLEFRLSVSGWRFIFGSFVAFKFGIIMQAILLDQFGGAENLYLGEHLTPVPGAREVLVRVGATALNRADILQREGKYPPPKGASSILGLEFAGTVEKVGADVRRCEVGDRVCGLLAGGGYAEYVVVHEGMTMPVPPSMTLEQAAAIPEVFLTAFQALVWLADTQAGERVLIHAGASGVGTAAIQLARGLGAQVGVTASAGKHEKCLALGAEWAIDYKTADFEGRIREQTSGEGVDVVLDFIGGPYLQSNFNLLRVDGRLIQLAMMGGVKVEQLNAVQLLVKRLKWMGSTLRSRSLGYKIRLTQAFLDHVDQGFTKGTLKPVIDSVYDWKEVAKAHQYMEANKNTGKIVLKVS
jgi:tumor protein p53-inducible protein 3